MNPHHSPVVLAAALLAGASLAASGQAQDSPPAPDQQPIRTEATFVRVDVYPTRDGRPVEGLTAEDFEIREDGVLQTIQSFEHVLVPIGPGTQLTDPGSQREMLQAAANPRARLVVIFLDVPHVDLAGSHEVHKPIITFVSRILGPDDLVGLMTPEMSAAQVVLGRKTQVIDEMLRRNWDWGKAGDPIPRLSEREHLWTICYPPGPGEGLYSRLALAMISKARQRMTLEALQDLVRYLGAIREERKAIVTVSGGWRLTGESPDLLELRSPNETPGREPITVGPTGQPRLGEWRNRMEGDVPKTECDADRMRLAHMDNVQFFRDLLDEANRANASFYPLDPGGLRAPAGGAPFDNEPLDRLRELALNTDGLAIVNSNDLDRGVRRVVDDLTSYYLVGYNTTNPKLDGRFRRIRVRVNKPGVEVRARRGYRAATRAEVAAAASTPATASAASPVESAMGELSRIRSDARFRINVAGRVENGEATIWIAGELPGGTDEFSAGATADMEVQAGDRSTSARVTLAPGERGFVTAVALPAAADTDVSVRARLSGEGSVEPLTDTIRVPLGDGAARPLLFRRGPATGNRLLPSADARFTRAERLRLELPVAASIAPGTAQMLDRTGNALHVPVRVGEKTDAAGRRWITADVALAPLAAGDYAIEQKPEGMNTVLTAIRVTR